MTIIIAEAGINHNGSMALARLLILRAKLCGCNAAKFQVYSVDKLFPDKQILAQDKNWYKEVKGTELTKNQVIDLADYCAHEKIEFLASAFDLERLGWLEEVGVKRHKIATRMNQNREYIDAVLATGKETLISSQTPVPYHSMFRPLYCIPEYPTPPEHLKLPDFNCNWKGFSDHTIGIEAAMMAISKGATYIEKHFTIDRHDTSGPDHICSSEPAEMKKLVEFARTGKICE